MMGRWLGWLGVSVILGALAGCAADPAPYTEAVKQKLEVQEDLIKILSTVSDPASMKAAQERLKQLRKTEATIEARFRKLPEPSADVKQRVLEEFSDRLQSNYQEMLAEIRRIRMLPGGEDFLEELGTPSSRTLP